MLRKSPAVIKTLLSACPNLEARTKRGMTPLHWAARVSKSSAVVQALLDAGADPKARDESSRTPWDLIQENPFLKSTDAYWRLNDARFE